MAPMVATSRYAPCGSANWTRRLPQRVSGLRSDSQYQGEERSARKGSGTNRWCRRLKDARIAFVREFLGADNVGLSGLRRDHLSALLGKPLIESSFRNVCNGQSRRTVEKSTLTATPQFGNQACSLGLQKAKACCFEA